MDGNKNPNSLPHLPWEEVVRICSGTGNTLLPYHQKTQREEMPALNMLAHLLIYMEDEELNKLKMAFHLPAETSTDSDILCALFDFLLTTSEMKPNLVIEALQERYNMLMASD